MSLDPLTDPDWALLARYFAGEATRPEADQVNAWLAEAPERRALVEELRRVWRQSAELLPDEDVDAALARIKERAAEPVVIPLSSASSTTSQPQPPPRRQWVRSLIRLPQAVAALLVLGLGTAVWQLVEHQQAAEVTQDVRMTDVATKRGERARLRLPDGSRVVLAPESRLRFAETFATNHRELYLEGEAYFEAVHDDTKPLRVHTDGAIAEDLGTAFVVRAYPGAPVQVAVSEGAVRLAARDSARATGVVLTLAERGTVRADGSIIHERGIDLGPEIGWAEGRLEFVDTPLRDAIVRLGRWYDLDIHLTDPSLGDLRLNATFGREAASEVLHLIGLILDVRVERHGSSVLLHRTGSHP